MQYLQEEILSFEKKLDAVDTRLVTTDRYCRQYLEHLLQHRQFYLRIYAEVLNRLQQHCAVPKEKMILVDYGAGNGMLGIFARYCGVGTVYINDINEVFVRAAKELAAMMQVDVKGFITGDAADIARSLHGQIPNAVAGTDVIEHIYNLPDFFSQLHKLNPKLVTVFTTASNTDNPFKNRRLKQLQRKDEYEGGAPGDYTLFGEVATEPFVVIREKMITAIAHSLSKEETALLVQHTRGMRKEDIEQAVKNYVTEKKLPPLLPHLTNTCDPVTGSWTERLLTTEEYNAIYAKAGFHCCFYNGFYNAWCGGMKGLIMQTANAGITMLGKYLAPFITLVGTPK
ncbi:MAG: 50S ribosomal protein L11 methyltransferase [Bacteroidetes bacterium]|nr:50S ribosomal protein L11 methyltransferase [Bacteroidota bacterium]